MRLLLTNAGQKLIGRTVMPRPKAFVLLALVSIYTQSALAGLGASVTLAPGAPPNVLPGEITTLEITLSNNNDSNAISSVAFANSLPGSGADRLKIAGAPSYTCFTPATNTTLPGSGTLTASVGSQSISLIGGVIPARDSGSSTDGSCTVLLPVTPESSDGAATNYTYTLASAAVSGNDPAPVNNVGTVNQSINVNRLNQPRLSKSFSSGTVVLGGSVSTLTIRVENPNPVPLPGFGFSDNFPTQGGGGSIIQVANPVSATSTCTAGTPAQFNPVAGATSISASAGTVAANSSCQITVAISARHTNGGYQSGRLTNRISATAQFSNDLGIRAQADATARVRARSPLGVNKSFSPSSLAHGQSGTLTIQLFNAGRTPLTVQSFTDSPLDGIGDLNPLKGIKANGSAVVTCTGGAASTPGSFSSTANNLGITQTSNTVIGAGNNCSIRVPVIAHTMEANTPITYTNSIAAGAVDVGIPSIVSRNRSATLLVADTLRLVKGTTASNPRPGNPVGYSIRVQNWSTSDMTNVRIRDPLNNNMTLLMGVIGGNDFTPVVAGAGCGSLAVNNVTGDSSTDFVIGTVPARRNSSSPGECRVNFYAMSDPAAADNSTTRNTLPAGSVCTDSGTGICNGSAASSPNVRIDTLILDIDKTFTPAGPLPEGAVTRMSIELQNFSSNTLTDATISDTLPLSGAVQMQVANPANAASNCGAGAITAVPGATSVALNNATVPPRSGLDNGAPGSCTLELDVTAAAGVYDNQATATATETLADGRARALAPVSDNTSITFTSILAARKSFSPNAVPSGGRATVRIVVQNTGQLPLSRVSVSDPLPAGMQVASPANAYSTCDGLTSLSATPGSSSVTLQGADIAAAGQCDLLFDVIATGTSDWENVLPVGAIEARDSGVINQSAVSATLAYNSGSALTVAKATNPSTLTFPGQQSRLNITVTNGTHAVTQMGLSDFFTVDGQSTSAPNGMEVTADPQAVTSCQGGVVSATPNDRKISLSGASMAPGESCTISVNVTSTTTGGITNFIPVGAISTDEGLSNAGQATTSLTTQTNLGVTKQFDPSVIKPGERSRLRITLLNPTPRAASSLSVTDNLPAGLEIAQGANPSTNCAGASLSAPSLTQVQMSGGNLPAASGTVPSSCSAEIDVVATAEGAYLNQIPAGGLTGVIGGVASSNSRPAQATLQVRTPLQIHKAIDNLTLDVGDPAGFTTGTATRRRGAVAILQIRLLNGNSDDLTEVNLVDDLPPGLVLADPPNASTNCGGTLVATAAGTRIALTGSTVPAGASCDVTAEILSNIPGEYTNTIPAEIVGSLEGVTNEEGTSAELLVASPPAVSKRFSPRVIPPNGTSRLELALLNDNPVAITLTSAFTDTLPNLPGDMLIAAAPNVASTCGGVVTAVAGGNSIGLANGATVPEGGCTISVDVTASAPGNHINSIPVGGLRTSVGDNELSVSADLLVSIEGFVSGRVFQDNDVTPDGLYNALVDAPIAGVDIELRDGADCGATVLSTYTSDDEGNYLFHSLAAGNYSVCQASQPAGTSNGLTMAGGIIAVRGSTGSIGTALNPTPGSSQITDILLNADGSGGAISGSADNDFPEIVLPSIAGRVFLDYNNNGLLNGPDQGLPGVRIELLGAGDVLLEFTLTDSMGAYAFTNLQPGTYSLRQPTQPINTSNGLVTPGSVANGGVPGSGTLPVVAPSRINTLVLPPNTASVDNDFAELPNTRTISGLVFMDFDDSGSREGSDYGIAGQMLELTGTDINGLAITSRQATTGANGAYYFGNLAAGSYTVTQPNQPASTNNGQTLVGGTGGSATVRLVTPSVIASIDLTGLNTVSGDNDFAEVPQAASDLTLIKQHSPDSLGAGSSSGFFTLLPANIGAQDTVGEVQVTDTLPNGLLLAGTPSGIGWNCTGDIGTSIVSCASAQVIAAGSNASPITVPVSVAANQAGQLITNTARVSGGGEPPAFGANNSDDDTVVIGGSATVSGTVWLDSNGDRVLDGGESRLDGWVVSLSLNGTRVLDAVTGAGGGYRFTNLSPGSGYSIGFRHPALTPPGGAAVSNERGLPVAQGVRDNTGGAVTSNTGNPAGASVQSTSLSNLTLFAGDEIIEQSLALVMMPANLPEPPAPPPVHTRPSPRTIPTIPPLGLIMLSLALLGVASRKSAKSGVRS